MLLNLFDLSSLEASGHQVQWPNGLDTASAHAIIFDFFSPMIRKEDGGTHEDIEIDRMVEEDPDAPTEQPNIGSAVDPIDDHSENHNFDLDNLAELLSLSDAGESVCWPVGLSAECVRRML